MLHKALAEHNTIHKLMAILYIIANWSDPADADTWNWIDDSNFSVRFPSENIFHVCYWIQFPLIGCSMNHFFVTILLLLASIMSSVHTSYRESSWRTCSVWRHIRTASSANILSRFSNFKKHASFSIMSINCVHQISPCAGLRRLILIHQSLWRRG